MHHIMPQTQQPLEHTRENDGSLIKMELDKFEFIQIKYSAINSNDERGESE